MALLSKAKLLTIQLLNLTTQVSSQLNFATQDTMVAVVFINTLLKYTNLYERRALSLCPKQHPHQAT